MKAHSGKRAELMRGAALAGMVFACVSTAFWDRPAKLLSFPLLAALSCIGWMWLYRHYRVIHDTPTSRIASAAQGYVELVGRAAMLPGPPLLSRSGKPCCWYSVQEFTRVPGTINWLKHQRRSSTEPFLLADETGVCVILPEGAGHFFTLHEARRTEGDHGYHEWILLAGDALCAAGELTTVNHAAPELAVTLTHEDVKVLIAERRKERNEMLDSGRAAAEHAAVGALIADWKTDPEGLGDRFDRDRDGTIDLKEWEHARMAARREVRRRATPQSEAPQRDAGDPAVEGIQVLRKPRDGRLFWIASDVPDTLGANARFGAGLLFLVFLYYAASLAWLVV